MKFNNYKIAITLTSIILIVFFGCCRKPAANTVVQKGIFGLHMHTYVDTNAFNPGLTTGEYAQEFPDKNNRWMNIITANLYITNISIHSATTGSWYTIPGSIMMKRLENEVYNLDSIPADTYDDLRFTIGLGSVLNNAAPSSYSTTTGADTVLSILENVMYAGPGKGYYFMYLTGNIDTSGAHNLNHPIPFTYAIAGDTLLVHPPSASGGNSFAILPTSQSPGPQLLHIIADYGKLLQSFSVTSPINVNTFSVPAQAAPVLDSIKNMFRYECSTPNGNC